MESDSVIYSLLGRIHLLMRRQINRITDVEYMRVSKEYSREIVRLGLETGHPELVELCERLRVAMDLNPQSESSHETHKGGGGLLSRLRGVRSEDSGDSRYIHSLR
jgi:hypothetical protein